MYIYVGDYSYAGSIHCSCLKFITPGFIGKSFDKTGYFRKKTTIIM